MRSSETPTAADQPVFAPSRRSQVPPFQVMTILGQVSQLRAAGHPVISLCAGEPGAGAPSVVNAAAERLYSSGQVLNYTPSLGIMPLREVIAEHYHRWYGLDISPTEVAVTTGSSGGFVAGFLAAFDVGDRVAMARPGYPAYRNILNALGCEVVELDAGPANGFQPTPQLLDKAVAEHGPLAGLVLASPNNPTGTMVSREELAELALWCTAHGVRLVSDEIYHGITYGDEGKGTCAWEFDRNSLVVSSFSKYWGMPGWRLGWLLLPEDLAPAVDGLSGSVSLCPPAAGQYAAVEAFSEEAYRESDAEVAEFARTRQLVLSQQSRLGWRNAAPADGAFYFYATPGEAMLSKYGTSTRYCQALLEQAYVALTPGIDFDGVHGDQYVRLSFAAGYDAVAEAIERIVAFQNG